MIFVSTCEAIRETDLFDEIEKRLAAKGNFRGMDYYRNIARDGQKSIFQVLCDTEKALTYMELADAFSARSGLEVAEGVRGEIVSHTKNYIETDVAVYIWHPLSKNLASRNDHGKPVLLVPWDVFDTYTISEAFRLEDDASSREGFIQKVIIPAVKMEATDIHIVPKETAGTYKLYFRVLGDLKHVMTMSLQRGSAITRTLLYWAKEFTPSISIDDNRRPQDGRIEVSREEATVALDMRLSFIPKPNMNDRDVVIRLLYKIDISDSTLHGLGFFPAHEKLMMDMSLKNKGIILVTGPTGTGKSRTINTILSKIDLSRNVLSVEDPVEYMLSNARQFQTFEYEGAEGRKSVVDFGDFARAFKRHDPDVIFIGELRDEVTVDTAFHLSKTGHLVFATLHASKATIVPQMLYHDYHVSIDEIADNLILATNQVLVKRICPNCSRKEPLEKIPEWLSYLSFANRDAAAGKLIGQPLRVRNAPLSEQAKNCTCKIKYENATVSTGYSGRTVLAECVPFTPEMFVDENISVMAMNKKTLAAGNILDDAVDKLLAGMIDIDALWRLI